ncbi:MAG: glycoside hydrolase family 25 protein [Chloroflexota bacterium]
MNEPNPEPQTVTPPAGRALGVDVSHWNDFVDFAALREGGVCFAVVKISQGSQLQDGRRIQHGSAARRAGLLTGGYHWCDPTHDPTRQVENFLRAAEGLQLDFCAVDVEQYWADWREWSSRNITRLVPPGQISRCARQVSEGIARRTGKPTLIYTRTTFVQAYAAPMQDWLAEWPLWLAQYPYPRGKLSVDWPALRREHLPHTFTPALPRGVKDWRMWQFSGDRFILPGGGGQPLDLNWFNGGLSDLRAWCGLDAPACPPPPPPLEEMVRLLWAAHPELHLEKS